MSIKRRDLIRYFEKNGFRLLREGSTIRYTQMMRKLFLLRDIEPSTELRPTNFANKLDLKQRFETAVIWKQELSKDPPCREFFSVVGSLE